MSADKITPTPRTDAAVFAFDQNYLKVNADFARQLERELTALRAQLAEARKENDTLRGLLGNSAKPCPYCGLAAEDQAKCQHGFPGCSRADDQMLSKHFADGYFAEQATKLLAERDAELAALKGHAGGGKVEYAWECNECGSQEYTMSVSEDDVQRLGCGNCGGCEWHKAEADK